MKIKREITNKVNWILDNLVPPIIRDNGLLMTPLFWLACGKDYPSIMNNTCKNHTTERKTDLTREVESVILDAIRGEFILDAGCGNGYLMDKLGGLGRSVLGIDMNPCKKNIIPGDITNLFYGNNHFDTVICTHVLEHIEDIRGALKELRRVAKQLLIVVVPRQREYKYTFDLHCHFFPYVNSFRRIAGDGECFVVGNDIIYIEEVRNG